MEVTVPERLEDALAELASHPETVVLAGGTDVMLGINSRSLRPARLLSVRRLRDLADLDVGQRVRCGSGVTFTELLGSPLDGAIRQAARTVGSAQIRNAGTLGGNLATCSPAGDSLPVLAVLEAEVVVRSADGERRILFENWMGGPRRPNLRPGELISAIEWNPLGGAQAFLKVGARNAMVISVAGLAIAVDRERRSVRVALGSVAPTVVRAPAAERFAEGLLDSSGWDRRVPPSPAELAEFGRLAATASSPIDDIRGTAAYRAHVVSVMASRALARTAA